MKAKILVNEIVESQLACFIIWNRLSIEDGSFGFSDPVFCFIENAAFFSDWFGVFATYFGVIGNRPIFLAIFTASLNVFLHDIT